MSEHIEQNIPDQLKKGNLPQAEILLRGWLEREPNNPKAFNFLGQIAFAVNLPEFARLYFSEAIKLAPNGRRHSSIWSGSISIWRGYLNQL